MAKSKSPKDKLAHRTSIKAVKRSEKKADTHEHGTAVPGQEYQPTANELIIYRRNLPHWRLRGAAYFVRWRKHKNQDDLQPGERDVVVDALRHFDGQRYELTAYVVMNDHVHVIVWPEDGYVLEDLCHSWKSFTAHEFQHKFGRIS